MAMTESAASASPLLGGAPAFRDLGGIATADGLRRVRSGLVYRSCVLLELSDEDVVTLRERLGVRTVIDLRDADEVQEDDGRAELGSDVTRLHVPLVDLMLVGAPRPDPSVAPELPLVARYLQFLEHGGDQLTTLLGHLADPAQQPLVFHCTAGKDRTGLVAAALLDVLGVGAEEIAADYAAARAQGAWLRAFLGRRRVQSRRVGSLDPRLLDADPETMRTLLRIVEQRHGGFAGLLLESGAEPELPARLREVLLEPEGG